MCLVRSQVEAKKYNSFAVINVRCFGIVSKQFIVMYVRINSFHLNNMLQQLSELSLVTRVSILLCTNLNCVDFE